MYKRAAEKKYLKYLHPLTFIPDNLKTQEVREKAVEEDPWQLGHVPDHLKTREMCEEVRCYPYPL